MIYNTFIFALGSLLPVFPFGDRRGCTLNYRQFDYDDEADELAYEW